MKILHLPLDSRPVHTSAVVMAAHNPASGHLLAQPDRRFLGNLTRRARPDVVEGLNQSADGVLMSVDTALYGGLVQARKSTMTPQATMMKTRGLLEMLWRHQDVPVVLSVVSPRVAVTVDNPGALALYEKITAAGDSVQTLEKLVTAQMNHYLKAQTRLMLVVELLAQAVAQTKHWRLAVYQEDCTPGGPQEAVRPLLRQLLAPLGTRGMVSLGADEMAFEGLGVLARHFFGGVPKTVRVLWSHEGAENIVPPFEDQPLGETLKTKMAFLGLSADEKATDALYLLAHPKPLDAMAGIRHWPKRPDWPEAETGIRRWFIADMFAANGGHPSLMRPLQRLMMADALGSYCGFNTASNRLGICLGLGRWGVGDPQGLLVSLNWRILEDIGYYSVVRPRAVQEAQARDAFIWRLGAHKKAMTMFINRELEKWTARTCLAPLPVELPWGRLFEIGPEGWEK